MIEIAPQSDIFNFYTSIFNQSLISEYRNEIIYIDFSNIKFFDPFGILFLKIYLERLINNENQIVVSLNDDVANYLVRMNFHDFFHSKQQIEFSPEIRDIELNRIDLGDRLMELREFTVQNDDEVEAVVDQIVQIVGNRIDFYQNIKEGLLLSLSESISNVQFHSQTNRALVILQSFSNQRIDIGIGDEGVGIKQGLKRLGEGLSDEDAIEKALEPLVTGKEDRGGYGLTSIKDYILENNDTLGIRSGSGFLYIRNREQNKGQCSFLNGTQLYLSLCAR